MKVPSLLALLAISNAHLFAAGDHLHGFGPPENWGRATTTATTETQVADVNGDHYDDIVLVFRGGAQDGDVYVLLNNGAGVFGTQALWGSHLVAPNEAAVFADFNGDGKADCALVEQLGGGALGTVRVALSSGAGFSAMPDVWNGGFAFAGEVIRAGDVNGDGLADIFSFTRGAGADVSVALSDGMSFGATLQWHGNFCPSTDIPAVADVDGDGKADIIAFQNTGTQSPGEVRVALARNGYFEPVPLGTLWHAGFAASGDVPAVGDVNGDGLADIVRFEQSTSDVFVAVSTGSAFDGLNHRYHADFAPGGTRPLVGRFDSDSNADIAAILPTGVLPGDVFVARAGGHAKIGYAGADFGVGVSGPVTSPGGIIGPVSGNRPLLVVMVNYPALPDPGAAWLTQYRDRFFGVGLNINAHPNIAAHYREMSGGVFKWVPAAGVGAYRVDMMAGEPQDWQLILRRVAQQGFSFRQFDTNGDGKVTQDELTIIEVNNGPAGGTTTSDPTNFVFEDSDNADVTLQIRQCVAAGAFYHLHAHEVSHTLGTTDLYLSGVIAAATGQTLIGASGSDISLIHLDPWHKMRLGWLSPRAVDIHDDYPGSLRLHSPQRADVAVQPPVIFYDSARGKSEYYFCETRAKQVAGSTQASPPQPAGGYDMDVAASGMIFWHVRTNPNYSARTFQLIHAGVDATLQSVVAPGSDDYVSGPPFIAQIIHSGPDGINQSIPVVGDVNYNVSNVLATINPTLWPDLAGYNANGNGYRVFTAPADSPVQAKWWGGTNVPRTFTLGNPVNGVAAIEWGTNFAPYIRTLISTGSVVRPGYVLNVLGSLGATTASPRMRRRDGTEVALTATNYFADGCNVTIPQQLPSGKYYLFFRSTADANRTSNSIEVAVFNRLVDWMLTYTNIVSPLPAGIYDPRADFDGDGLQNIFEFAMGSNPADGTDGMQHVTLNLDTNGTPVFRWREDNINAAAATLTPQFSTDLVTWTDTTKTSVSATAAQTIWQADIATPAPPKLFLRLRVVFAP